MFAKFIDWTDCNKDIHNFRDTEWTFLLKKYFPVDIHNIWNCAVKDCCKLFCCIHIAFKYYFTTDLSIIQILYFFEKDKALFLYLAILYNFTDLLNLLTYLTYVRVTNLSKYVRSVDYCKLHSLSLTYLFPMVTPYSCFLWSLARLLACTMKKVICLLTKNVNYLLTYLLTWFAVLSTCIDDQTDFWKSFKCERWRIWKVK